MGLDMDKSHYMSESTWRAEMLAAQISMRQAIRELAFLIAALFLAFALSAYWSGLAVVVGAVMCAGAIFAIWRENRSEVAAMESMVAATAEPER
jgi:hypothetical protein